MNERIIIAPTIWLPILAVLLTLAVVAGVKWAGEDDPTRTVADDCLSDLVVKQQTGQIGRYGIVWGLGENAPLTRGVLKAICEGAWSIVGPQHSPLPFSCGGHQLNVPGGTPYPDPDCEPPSTPQPTCTIPLVPKCRVEQTTETPPPTIDASPTVQSPTPTPYTTLNCASPPQGFSACLFTPTPTAAALPDTGGMP